jgi:DNA helicase IV
MLATVALALDPRAAGEWVGHLIVDEAQDVRPLEWRILMRSLLESGGSLSLFGDMNQRRSDWTAGSWEQLAEDLELTDDDGTCDIHELDKGYRSTRQILKFANQLLPRGERGEQALRDGPQPTITRVPQDRRATSSVDAAIELTTRHTGMVALISNDPRPASVEFRKRSWVRGRHQHSWTLNGATVVILHPDEARGLEFDAAVVVEPGEFPENVGRQGVLYTSLTRANKELIVVHVRPLPRGLRPR